ncbi:MAG TPA: hypothetical protein VMV91_07035 [Rhodocyclaceae bacterium]|nr:hypothetical protein [Rhodocyclaceae bacterium]HUW52515.1 hypothetical protein [Rhodanobacter sp.]
MRNLATSALATGGANAGTVHHHRRAGCHKTRDGTDAARHPVPIIHRDAPAGDDHIWQVSLARWLHAPARGDR